MSQDKLGSVGKAAGRGLNMSHVQWEMREPLGSRLVVLD